MEQQLDMNKIGCVLCNDGKEKLLYEIKANPFDYLWKVVRCEKCGLTYLNPQPEKETLLKFYRKRYSLADERRLRPLFEKLIYFFRKQRAREILRLKEKGEILDIGCGRGLMLKYLKEKGWGVKGIEFSEGTASIAKSLLKDDVYIGEGSLKRFDKEKFDVVILDYVLEHLTNPYEVLEEVNRILKKGGFLVASVPMSPRNLEARTVSSWNFSEP